MMARGHRTAAAGRDEAPSDEVEDLVERAIAGDDAAFAGLYRRMAPQLTRRLYFLLFNRSDVEDVLQATFFEAFRNLGRFRRGSAFAAWLHGICYNVARTHLRTLRRKRWLHLAPEQELDCNADLLSRSPAVDAETRQNAQQVLAAIARLPENKRLAFALHEIEGLGLREIGELTGQSPKTIWSHVQQARAQIRRQLGLAPTEVADEGRS